MSVSIQVQPYCSCISCGKIFQWENKAKKEYKNGNQNMFYYVCPFCGGRIHVIDTGSVWEKSE